jgi:hypothetical protein
VATWQLVYYKLAPDHLAKWSAYEVDKAKKSGASDEQIAAKTKEMAELNEKLKNPLVNIALTFLEPLPVGILITLVTAGLLSRKRRTTGAAGEAVA